MQPLKDIKILDLSEKLSVSLATMYLSNFGAQVTKIEKPKTGDAVRRWEPMSGEESIYFNYLNNGKESITLDITTKEGGEILKKLVVGYDVICVSTPPGYMESLGLGYEQLKEIKADLIYGSITCFGMEGPSAYRAGSSLVAQAKGVAMDMTGIINSEPVSLAPSLTEHYASGYLMTGILMAMADKNVRGIGQKIDISLQDSIFSCIETAPAAYSTIGEVHTRKGNNDPSCAPYDTFETSDGFVAIGCATENQWQKLCDALGFEDLKNSPRFDNVSKRITDYFIKLRPILEDKMRFLSKDEITEKCGAVGVPCFAVLNIAEITDMPNTIENGFLMAVESGDLGTIKRPALPFVLSYTPAEIAADAPKLGCDTVDILTKAGFSSKEIFDLMSKHII